MTIQDLNAFGAKTAEGLERCMNNEGFYLRLVKMAANDGGFQKLYDALAAGDLTAGFEAAHALKGSLGNLALTPVFEPVAEITELLRAHTETDYSELEQKIKEAHKRLLEICEG